MHHKVRRTVLYQRGHCRRKRPGIRRPGVEVNDRMSCGWLSDAYKARRDYRWSRVSIAAGIKLSVRNDARTPSSGPMTIASMMERSVQCRQSRSLPTCDRDPVGSALQEDGAHRALKGIL
jgi:hypothetical protein